MRVIRDKNITDNNFIEIVFRTAERLLDTEYGQMDIYNILKPQGYSCTTIAKVINELIPTAKATRGSVHSLVRYVSKRKEVNHKKEAN